MTNKELQKKIAHLEAELAEVKKQVAALPKKVDGGVFKPEDRERYWYVSGSGEVYTDQWSNCPINHDYHLIGNCFPTKQAAEATVRVRKLVQKAKESQDGFVPDWENSTQNKYFLYFHMGDIGVADYPSINVAPIFGFWEGKSECEQFIKDNHDELIWFFKEYRR